MDMADRIGNNYWFNRRRSLTRSTIQGVEEEYNWERCTAAACL
ncbi:unnamed protein product [Musa acuminata var. zebrina]